MKRFSKYLTEKEQELIHKNYKFYHALEIGIKEPENEEQKHFLAVCKEESEPKTMHEIAYFKHLKLRSELKEESNEQNPDTPNSTAAYLSNVYPKIFDKLEHLKNEDEKEEDIINAARVLNENGKIKGKNDFISHLYQVADEIEDPWEKIYTFMEITDTFHPHDTEELNFDNHYSFEPEF